MTDMPPYIEIERLVALLFKKFYGAVKHMCITPSCVLIGIAVRTAIAFWCHVQSVDAWFLCRANVPFADMSRAVTGFFQ